MMRIGGAVARWRHLVSQIARTAEADLTFSPCNNETMVQLSVCGLDAVRFTGWHAAGLMFMLIFACINGAAAVHGGDDVSTLTYRTPSQRVVPIGNSGSKFAFYPQFTPHPQIFSMPTANNSNDPLIVFPQFIGALMSNQKIQVCCAALQPLFHSCFQWKGMCFTNNTAILTSLSPSGATLIFDMESPRSKLCSEQLFFATSEGYYVHPIFTRGTHEFSIKAWRSNDEYLDVIHNGVRVFIFDASMLGLIVDAAEFAMMFAGPWSESETIAFFHKNMKWDLQKRSNPTAFHINEKLVHSVC